MKRAAERAAQVDTPRGRNLLGQPGYAGAHVIGSGHGFILRRFEDSVTRFFS
jgi:hypothetical protein